MSNGTGDNKVRRHFVSSSSVALGIVISLLLVIVPLFVQGVAFVFLVPGERLIGFLGGRGLHDKFGLLYFAAGMLLDVLLYASIVTVLAEVIRRRKMRTDSDQALRTMG
jgi:hypothetical protein